MSQFALLKQRRFGPLFWTQFFGAFNDNALKSAIMILFTFATKEQTVEQGETHVHLAGALFILPFVLLSATSGQFADKLEKSRIVRGVKLFELGIMGVASIGFWLHSIPLLLSSLFLMGVHSTVFGPVKYSILPQHLKETELVGGNGLIESGSFIAILLGTITGGFASGRVVSVVLIALSLLGYIASRGIPEAPALDPTLRVRYNLLRETAATLRLVGENRTVLNSILGASWFWFYGALFLGEFPGFCKETLGGDQYLPTLLLMAFSIGIGIGSVMCERLSAGRIELGLVPFGSIGLSLFAADLAFVGMRWHAGAGASVGPLAFLSSSGGLHILLDLILIGIFGGFFIVPLYALIQQRSKPSVRSRIIAGNNILNALFMVVASLLAEALRRVGLSIPHLFLVTAVLNALVAIYIYTLIPEFLMRFLIWILINTIYRVKETDLANIPEEGPAVLVSNHVSFVDALVIGGVCRRPVRFVMDHRIFKIPVLSFIFRTSRAIPIAPQKEDAALMEKAFDEIESALQAGDLVCIFPEGKLTATGEMSPFRPGVERIIARSPVPVIPLALRGLWGSFFSRKGGPAMRRPFRRFWSHVELAAGAPVPAANVTALDLEHRVAALRGDAL